MEIVKRAGLVLLTAAIVACSGSGDGSGLAPTAAPGAPVGGVPVKGPLANAMLEGFELDPTAENGEGALADTGFTDAQARIQDFNLTDGPDYVVQVSLTADTEDLSTGAAPLLFPLRSIISSEQIIAGTGVYPSPATTALIALADALGDVNELNLTEARDRLLPVILPGILPADADFFSLVPIVTNDAGQVLGKESEIVSFRVFSEAIVALLQDMADNDAGIADVNAAFAVFIADLADDGELQSAQGLSVNTQEPSTIPLPGRPGETLADVAALMSSERSDTGLTELDVTLIQPQPEDGVESRPDNDADGVPNHLDNCIDTANPDQANFDEDRQGDACDSDDDNDGLADTAEISTNPKDPDSDDDGALDGADNCPLTGPNDQTDTDNDGAGNVCDDDDDNDGSSDAEETQRGTNPLVADTDNDGVDDPADNCPLTGPNDQTDTDSDGAGDVCDTDDDDDGLSDAEEQSIGTNPLVADTDSDSVNDGQDNCPLFSHPDQTDTDQDGAGDVCDNDDDNDGLNDADETVTNPKDPDTDDDGALDGADNCPLTGPNDQTDTDGDGAGNVCDADDDNDGLNDVDETNSDPLDADTDDDTVGDADDNCPRTPNVDQGNADGDANGDACDNDDDNDGLSDAEEQQLGTNPLNGDTDNDTIGDADDNCPVDANTDQADFENDGQGDVCDADDDNDGSTDEQESTRGTDPKDADSDDDGAQDGADNCPLTGPNDQSDNDVDGQGDICDTDDDNDSVDDTIDNCPFTANQPQADFDGDGQGDACDADRDDDGLNDDVDECPVTPVDQRGSINAQGCGPDEVDTDNDGLFDPEDNCPAIANPDQANNDGDAQGDVCDNDDDNDGVDDGADNCPITENSDQLNTDGDTQGNVCDDDDDNDNVADAADNCPLASNENQADQDGDNVGDACDEDVDGDGLDGAAEQEQGTDPNKADTDGDGSDDGVDNCPINSNPDQVDTDKDGAGNLCDPDDDNDGLSDIEEAQQGSDPFKADTDDDGQGDASDNCPADANADQADFDNDQRGDVCDPDDDNDGLSDVDEDAAGTNPKKADTDDDTVEDGSDNCPLTGPADQTDTDGDGKGDVCDEDIDGDTVENGADNCPNDANTDQANFDGDSLGDACDNDIDGDGVEEPTDICPNTPSEEHGDIDAQGCGPSELDTDDDGFSNADDNCPTVANADQSNIDNDALGDACDDDKDGDNIDNDVDNCPAVSNEDQLNSDGADDGGNACDDDDDNDQRLDGVDNCPMDHNTDQADQDSDNIGDACDPDRDGDGVDNDVDNCPFIENEDQANADNDSEGDVCDNDRDNDGTDDIFDNCPDIANQTQVDTDGDGAGNACDTNDDNDALDDDQDNCPLVENDDQNDFDGDNQGDACDADDDNDGFDDGQDVCPFTPEGDTPDSVGCGPNDVPASGSGIFHSSELRRSQSGGGQGISVEWGFYEAFDENGLVTLTPGAGNQRKQSFSEVEAGEDDTREARRDAATGALQHLGDIDLGVGDDLSDEDAGLFVAQSHWLQPMPGRFLVGERLSLYRPLRIDAVDSADESRTLTPSWRGNSVDSAQWVLAPLSSGLDESILPSRLGLVTVGVTSSRHRFGLSEFNINGDGSASESSFRIRDFRDSGTCCGGASSPTDLPVDNSSGGYRGQAVDVLFDVTGNGGATLEIYGANQTLIDKQIGFVGASGAGMLLRQTDADPMGQMGHSFGLPLPPVDQMPDVEGKQFRISGSVSGMQNIGIITFRGMTLSLEAGGVARLSGEQERHLHRTVSGFGFDGLEGFVYQQRVNDALQGTTVIDQTGSWQAEQGGRIRLDFPDFLGEQVAADGFVNVNGDALALAWMATLPNGGWGGNEPANASGLVLGSTVILPQENVRPQVTQITTNGLDKNFIAESGEVLPLHASVNDVDNDVVNVEWQSYFGSFSNVSTASTNWIPEPDEDDNTLLVVGIDDGTDGSFGVVGVWGGELDREGTISEQYRAAKAFDELFIDTSDINDAFFWDPETPTSRTVPCESGSGNSVVNDNNNDDRFNAGDTWELTFNDCVKSDVDEVETLNGRILITVENGDFATGIGSTVLIQMFAFSEEDVETDGTYLTVKDGAYRQTINDFRMDSTDDYIEYRDVSISVPERFSIDYRDTPNDPEDDSSGGRINYRSACAADYELDWGVNEWSLALDCQISVGAFGSSVDTVSGRVRTGPGERPIEGVVEYPDNQETFSIADSNAELLMDISAFDRQSVTDFSLLMEFDDNGLLEYFAQTAGNEPYIIDAFNLDEVYEISDDGLDLWPLNTALQGEIHRFVGIDMEFSVFPNKDSFGGTKQASGIIFERGQFGINGTAAADFEFETMGGPVLGRGSSQHDIFVFYEGDDVEQESLLEELSSGPSFLFSGLGIEQEDEGEFDKAHAEIFSDAFLGLTSTSQSYNVLNAGFGSSRFGVTERDGVERVTPFVFYGVGIESENAAGGRVVTDLTSDQLPSGDVGVVFLYADMEIQYSNGAESEREICAGVFQLQFGTDSQLVAPERGREACAFYEASTGDGRSELEITMPSDNDEPDARPVGGINILDATEALVEMRNDFTEWEEDDGYSLIESDGGLFTAVAGGDLFLSANDESAAFMVPYNYGGQLASGNWRLASSAMGMGENGINRLLLMNGMELSISAGVPSLSGSMVLASRETEASALQRENFAVDTTGTMRSGDIGEIIIEFPDLFLTFTGFVTRSGELAVGNVMRFENGVEELMLGLWNAIRPNNGSELSVTDRPPSFAFEIVAGGVVQTPDQFGFYRLTAGDDVTINVASDDPDGDAVSYRYEVTDGTLNGGQNADDFEGQVVESDSATQVWTLPGLAGDGFLLVQARAGLKANGVTVPVIWSQ